MKHVNVTLQIDEELKERADELFEDLGMSFDTAVVVFLRQSLREQKIPFVVGRRGPNEVTLAAMDAAEREEDLYGPFDSVEALMEALNA